MGSRGQRVDEGLEPSSSSSSSSSAANGFTINLKWMNPELLLSSIQSDSSSSSTTKSQLKQQEQCELPTHVHITNNNSNDDIRNITFRQLQDRIWEQIMLLNKASSSNAFSMNFIYKGNILNPTIKKATATSSSQTQEQQQQHDDPDSVLLCNVIPSLEETSFGTITLFVVLIQTTDSSSSDRNTNGKRSGPNNTHNNQHSNITTSTSTSTSSSNLSKHSNSIPTASTTTAAPTTINDVLEQEEGELSQSSAPSMEQMVQQMFRNSNNGNGSNPMIDQLQSQFPDHNIRDMLSQLGGNGSTDPQYIQQQMERSLELQLSQLDHIPGGMSVIQNAYEQQMDQWDSIMNSSSSDNGSGLGNNPFIMNLLNQITGNTNNNNNSLNNSKNDSDNHTDIAGSSGRAMPNPWGTNHSNSNSRQRRRTTATPYSQQQQEGSEQEQLLSSLFSSLQHRPTRPTSRTSAPTLNSNPIIVPPQIVLPQNSSNLNNQIENTPGTTIPLTNPWLEHASDDDNGMEEAHKQQEVDSVATSPTPLVSTNNEEQQQHEQEHIEQEQLLFDMGFTNRNQNRIILQQNQYQFDNAVEMLLLLQSSNDNNNNSGSNDSNESQHTSE